MKNRLVTRSDFDGIVCALLLKEMDLIDEIKFVHPKDVQDGLVQIEARDITTNLPYRKEAELAFDHHFSETMRLENARNENLILKPGASSTANVLFEYYGGHAKFGSKFDEMLNAVNKADSAQFSVEEILNPKGWALLNFIVDPRTGIGRFYENFQTSNYNFMTFLIDYCMEGHTIDEILETPEVKERVDLYFNHADKFKEQLQKCSTVYGNLVVINLKDEKTIYAGNRFLIYALFPKCNISMHCMWGLKQQNTVFAIGKSIINRTSRTNIGKLMLSYGGGGHENAGTCQIDNDIADSIMKNIIHKINFDG